MVNKGEFLYEGKTKKVFKTNDPDLYIIEYKDDATAFNGEKKGIIVGKGQLNNNISSHFFKVLHDNGIKTHFVEQISSTEMVVRSVEIIPIEVIVRNIAAGSMAKKMGLEEGTALKCPVIEFCYKKDELGDPMINSYHAVALDIATKEQIDTIEKNALNINEILRVYLFTKGIILVDLKLEFGICKGEIIIADEISPDTCRFWDNLTKEKMDKDRFRRDLGNIIEGYQEIWKRLTGGYKNV